jgi:hypothetical protein
LQVGITIATIASSSQIIATIQDANSPSRLSRPTGRRSIVSSHDLLEPRRRARRDCERRADFIWLNVLTELKAIYCGKQRIKRFLILMKYPLENSMHQIQVLNEMEFIEIRNVLAVIDRASSNQKRAVLFNRHHRDDVVV